jgi:hypothetical protein
MFKVQSIAFVQMVPLQYPHRDHQNLTLKPKPYTLRIHRHVLTTLGQCIVRNYSGFVYSTSASET